MPIEWNTNVIFLFDSWTVQANQPAWFATACALIAVFVLLIHLFKNYRNRMLEKCHLGKERFTNMHNWLTALFQGFIYVCDALLMLLMMSFNGYVILTVIVFNTIGYIFLNKEYAQRSRESSRSDCIENHLCCN